MLEAERELAALGVPIKTRHNEVAPGQYEIAPVFENANVGSDHQQLTMQVLQSVARRHGLVCLLHEKPFAGLNGSGKHNNWSIGTDTGENLLDPGDTPAREPALPVPLRGGHAGRRHAPGPAARAIATAGNDHRLGANEAPPAIMSMFLGAELETILDALASGAGDAATPGDLLALGTPVLPPLPKDGGDRNRTCPFAFTGNKFEFRAVGSSHVRRAREHGLNTIVADAVAGLTERLGARPRHRRDARGRGPGDRPRRLRRAPAHRVPRDGYAGAWQEEAAARGLLNLRTTPDALPHLVTPEAVAVFARHGVLSERELEARYEVFVEEYATRVGIEGATAAQIARTLLVPAALHQRRLSRRRRAARADAHGELDEVLEALVEGVRALEGSNASGGDEGAARALRVRDEILPAMGAVRAAADRLEHLVADELWPLPRYAEMLHQR